MNFLKRILGFEKVDKVEAKIDEKAHKLEQQKKYIEEMSKGTWEIVFKRPGRHSSICIIEKRKEDGMERAFMFFPDNTAKHANPEVLRYNLRNNEDLLNPTNSIMNMSVVVSPDLYQVSQVGNSVDFNLLNEDGRTPVPTEYKGFMGSIAPESPSHCK